MDFTTPMRLGKVDAKTRELVVCKCGPPSIPTLASFFGAHFTLLLFCFHLFCYLPYQYSTYAVINQKGIGRESSQ